MAYVVDGDVEEILELAVFQRHYRRAHPAPRFFRDRTNPMEMYDDVEFRCRFRLPKEVVIELAEEFKDNLTLSRRLGVLSPLMQLLVALRFYATSSFQVII